MVIDQNSCPLHQGEDEQCYNSDSCGGQDGMCPFIHITKNVAQRYWKSVQSAWSVWSTFAKVQGLINAWNQGPVYGRIKEIIDERYRGNRAALDSEYYALRKQIKAWVQHTNKIGDDLGFAPMSSDGFIDYIEKMSNSERNRCLSLIKQYVEQPERFPFFEILQRNFRKYQK